MIISKVKTIRLIFAKDNPITEKIISSHLAIGVFSRDCLRDSISSKLLLLEVQLLL